MSPYFIIQSSFHILYKEEIMKQTIRIYLNTLLLFLIPFLCLSFILAIISYFIPLNDVFLEIISYLGLIIAALYFTSQWSHHRMKHCLIMSLFYFLLSLLIHLGNIHLIHLFLKPLIFVMIGGMKELRNKKS